MSIIYRNTFATNVGDGNSYDLQRSDLFQINISLPAAVAAKQLTWDNDVQFAVEKFPFPARSIDEITIKYLNQVNKMPGADAATGDTTMSLRYAFSQRTAQAIEYWYRLVSNPLTGGTGLPSAVKTVGSITHLVPSMAQQIADLDLAQYTNDDASFAPGLVWYMDGIWPKSFTMSDLDMTGSGVVTCNVTWAIDRWYPGSIRDMQVQPR